MYLKNSALKAVKKVDQLGRKKKGCKKKVSFNAKPNYMTATMSQKEFQSEEDYQEELSKKKSTQNVTID